MTHTPAISSIQNHLTKLEDEGYFLFEIISIGRYCEVTAFNKEGKVAGTSMSSFAEAARNCYEAAKERKSEAC